MLRRKTKYLLSTMLSLIMAAALLFSNAQVRAATLTDDVESSSDLKKVESEKNSTEDNKADNKEPLTDLEKSEDNKPSNSSDTKDLEIKEESKEIEPTESTTSDEQTEPVKQTDPVEQNESVEQSEQIKQTECIKEESLPDKEYSIDDVNDDLTFIAKFTFVSNDTPDDTTLDDVFTAEDYVSNFTLYEEIPVYIVDENTYMVKADAPLNNGFITKAPIDVCFARANQKGEVLTSGITWDKEKCMAFIDKDVLEAGNDDDFADMQMQLLCACEGSEKKVSVNTNIMNNDGLIELNTTEDHIESGAYDMPFIRLATDETKENITKHEIGVFVNECPYPLNDNQYSYENGNISILTPAALIERIDIIVMKRDTMLLNNCEDFSHSGWTSSCFPDGSWAYIKPDVNMSDLKVGSKSDINIYVGRTAGSVNSGWLAGYYQPAGEDYFENRFNLGHLNYICIPRNKFNRDLTLYYDKDCTMWNYGVDGSTVYDQAVPAYCTHISKSNGLSTANEVRGFVQLQNIDRSNPNYTSYIFTAQTYSGTHGGSATTNQAQSTVYLYRQLKKAPPLPPKPPKQFYTIRVNKTLAGQNIPLQGVTFALYKDNTIYRTCDTNKAGEALFKFEEEGNYEVKEYKCPGDLKLNDSSISIRVSNGHIECKHVENKAKEGFKYSISGPNMALDYEDKPVKVNFTITKKNEKGKYLPDAVFKLYKNPECTDLYASGITDYSGKINFSSIDFNRPLYLKETKAPPGYYTPHDSNGKDIVTKIEFKTDFKDRKNVGLYINDKYENGPYTFGALAVSKDGQYTGYIKVINNTSYYKLPETGSHTRIIFTTAGIILLFACLFIKTKDKYN